MTRKPRRQQVTRTPRRKQVKASGARNASLSRNGHAIAHDYRTVSLSRTICDDGDDVHDHDGIDDYDGSQDKLVKM